MPDPGAKHAQVEWNLTNHPPAGPEIVARFEELRSAAKTLGHCIVDLCPESRERSLAMTSLEQAVMWAVAAIARNQEPLDA